MVGDGGEEGIEYESDPEEAKISLKMRRREASDDEDDVAQSPHRTPSVAVDSDAESDGQGAATEYDGGEEDEEEEYYDGEYEEEIDEGVGGGEVEVPVEKVVEKGLNEGNEVIGESRGEGDGEGEGEGEGETEEEENKEKEPFAVPTSGAFYMHDDRFCDNTAGGRNRRTFGGRRLWETKDERKWGHDKFEEMNMRDRHYEGRRSSKGYYRGRGRGRDIDRGRGRGTGRGRIRPYGGSNNQNLAPKDVRGRGARRYHLSLKNGSETLPTQNKQSTKSIDKTSNTGLGRNSASTANSSVKYEAIPARKVASNLNYASPPFYPSGSSNKDVSHTQEELQAADHSRNLHPSVVDQSKCMPPLNSLLAENNAVDPISLGKLQIGDSVSPASSKPLNNMRVASSSSSSSSALPKFGAQGRGFTLSGSTVFHTPEANNQVHKVPPPTAHASQPNPAQNQKQDSLEVSVQQLAQHSLGASQGPSLKAGKGNAQGAGMGSLMYAGPHVLGSGGNTSAGRGDQNLPNFFPVMPFGAQHAGGIGVPAVGMAFPGYVAQPNGLGNSEMTWLPLLASATGAMGATYCPPYMTVDGTYQPRPAEQTFALPASSKENNLAKSNNGVRPLQKSEVSNDELSQRQNKPRRYSEMKFSQ